MAGGLADRIFSCTEATAFASAPPALRRTSLAGRGSGEQPLRSLGASASHTVALAAAAAGAYFAAGGVTRGKVVRSRARGGSDITSESLTPTAGCMEPFDASKSAVGITYPLGFWDPLSLSKRRDDDTEELVWKSEDEFYTLQEAEIKHGRVAMLAAAGLLAATFSPFPGFEDIPSGAAALGTKAGAGMGIILIGAGWLELAWRASPNKEPGNLGDPAGLLDNAGTINEQYLGYSADMRNKEINHGRLAMSGVITELLVEYQTGMGPGEQLTYVVTHGAPPVLAFLLLAFLQTPELTEADVEKIKANMSGDRATTALVKR